MNAVLFTGSVVASVCLGALGCTRGDAGNPAPEPAASVSVKAQSSPAVDASNVPAIPAPSTVAVDANSALANGIDTPHPANSAPDDAGAPFDAGARTALTAGKNKGHCPAGLVEVTVCNGGGVKCGDCPDCKPCGAGCTTTCGVSPPVFRSDSPQGMVCDTGVNGAANCRPRVPLPGKRTGTNSF